MPADYKHSPGMYETDFIDYINAALVINDWYTPLVATPNCKLWYLSVEQTNNGAAIETLEVEITTATGLYLDNSAMVSGTQYYFFFDMDGVLDRAGPARQLVSLDADQSAPLESHSIQVRVRQVTAVDPAGAQIEANMTYAYKY